MHRIGWSALALVLGCSSQTAGELAPPVPPVPAAELPVEPQPAEPPEPAKPPATPAKPGLAAHELDAATLAEVWSTHVHGGRVDYTGLAADASARASLKAFLQSASSMHPEAPLASWLNVYNAMVVQLVVERYPIDSVMSVPDFFKALTLPVAGEPRSLDAIENVVIRPRFADARVHMALNCGAVSCPHLAPKPFVQATLDDALNGLALAAVDSDAHVRLTRGRLHVSKLFEWFAADFERDAGSVLTWIRRHSTRDVVRQVPDGAKLVYLPYDWALADAKPR